MPFTSPSVRLAATASTLLLALHGPAVALDVRSYASQVNDVDAVNTHWFETSDGAVIVDAQRILPEAERALEHLRATTDQPVTAIVITHAHTDHYGGLPVWTAAFPEAVIYTDRTTHDSIVNDRRGFIAARRERHGERFPTLGELQSAMANATIVADGQEIDVGKTALTFHVLGASEAEAHTLVTVPEENVTFVGDLVSVGVPAVPLESLDAWLAQLALLETRFDGHRLYQGHGPAPIAGAEIAEQRRFLERLDELVVDAVADGTFDVDERDAAVFALEAEWPFHAGVAGNTRQQILGFSLQRVAEQKGAELGEGVGFGIAEGDE
ncbi:MAG: MBL fold metallo-hydrolase [Pseudomonadota bacterium]